MTNKAQSTRHIESLRVLHERRHLLRHWHQTGAPQSSTTVSRNMHMKSRIAMATMAERRRIHSLTEESHGARRIKSSVHRDVLACARDTLSPDAAGWLAQSGGAVRVQRSLANRDSRSLTCSRSPKTVVRGGPSSPADNRCHTRSRAATSTWPR